MTTNLFFSLRWRRCNDHRKHGSPLLPRTLLRDYPIYLLYSAFLGSYLWEGCKSARSSLMSDDTARIPSVCTSVPGARFCLIEFIVSSGLTRYGAAANGGSPSCAIELLRRDDEGWHKSVRRHGKSKEKESLRAANLWEGTVRGISFLKQGY